MKRQRLPKNPKIVLFANNRIGLEIARYLKEQKENIVALVTHPSEAEELSDNIKKSLNVPHTFTALDLYNPKVLRTLQSLKPDIGICAWFGYILKKDLIHLFPCGIINTHNSYLPYNRGKYPQSWAIANQTPYGITLHYIDEGIDTGDIIIRKPIPIGITDNGATLYNKSIDLIIKTFKTSWPKIKLGKIQPIKQHANKGDHHFAKNSIMLDKINLNQQYKAIDLINQIRARNFDNRTYSYFLYKGEKIYIKMTLSK